MGLKHHTIIFVPHARARFRKLRVTNRQIAIFGGALVLVLLASLFTTWSFFTNTVNHQALTQLSSENDELRQVNQSFETSIRQLQKRLVEFEDKTRQLAIVAGLENLAMGQETGIGGTDLAPEPGRAADWSERLTDLDDRADLLAEDMDRVDGLLDERLRLISSTPAISPVKGILTSGYGRRRDPITGKPSLHAAIDISTAPNHPVLASADGIVVRAGRIGGLGNAIYLSHGYGITTRYGHLSKISVTPGTRVERGDTIGYVGNTGRATGYHLHYEVRVDGKPDNPLAYILDSTG